MGRNRALGAPFEIANTATSATTESHIDMYAVDAALGTPVTITLDPNAFNGDQVIVQDVGNNAGAQAITVAASPGQTILNGFGSTLSISTDGAGVLFTFDHALDAWVPQVTGAGGGGGGSVSSYVIYRPGTPSAKTAVETWAEVKSAIANGAILVIVDSSLSPGDIAHVPGSSGVTDMTGVTLAPWVNVNLFPSRATRSTTCKSTTAPRSTGSRRSTASSESFSTPRPWPG